MLIIRPDRHRDETIVLHSRIIILIKFVVIVIMVVVIFIRIVGNIVIMPVVVFIRIAGNIVITPIVNYAVSHNIVSHCWMAANPKRLALHSRLLRLDMMNRHAVHADHMYDQMSTTEKAKVCCTMFHDAEASSHDTVHPHRLSTTSCDTVGSREQILSVSMNMSVHFTR